MDPERQQTPKPSIYDPPVQRLRLVDDPSLLELALRRSRHQVEAQYARVRTSVDRVLDRWMGLETRVRAATRGLTDPNERLVPGAGTVLVATLAAMVLVRSRGAFLRTLAPTAVALAAVRLTYPGTSARVTDAAYRELEQFDSVRPALHEAAAMRRSLDDWVRSHALSTNAAVQSSLDAAAAQWQKWQAWLHGVEQRVGNALDERLTQAQRDAHAAYNQMAQAVREDDDSKPVSSST